jgi:hypothetical protein
VVLEGPGERRDGRVGTERYELLGDDILNVHDPSGPRIEVAVCSRFDDTSTSD